MCCGKSTENFDLSAPENFVFAYDCGSFRPETLTVTLS